MTRKHSDEDVEQSAQLVALFAALIQAWKDNDFHRAARTRDELERTGVRVQIPGRRKTQKEADNG